MAQLFSLGHMALNALQISGLVEAELARITSPQVSALLRSLLVTPRCESRAWDYGEPGTEYPCWIVAEHSPSNTAFAYCEQGFGPSFPWGLLFISGKYLSIGMDSDWHETLEEVFRESQAWPESSSTLV